MPRKTENKQEPYRAQGVRQGETILRTKARRVIFIGGLIGFVALVFLLQFLGG